MGKNKGLAKNEIWRTLSIKGPPTKSMQLFITKFELESGNVAHTAATI